MGSITSAISNFISTILVIGVTSVFMQKAYYEIKKETLHQLMKPKPSLTIFTKRMTK